MRNKLRFLLAVVLYTMFSGTNALLDSDVFDLHLGDGYSTFDRISVGQTALNNLPAIPVIYSNIQSIVDLTNTVDRKDLTKDLNVDMSVSGGWGIFSSSASADYMRHTENTDYKDNFSYMEIFYTNGRLDISKLPGNITAFTRAAQNEYTKYGVKKFTDKYGDQFVQQLPLGAILVVNIQIHFDKLVDKENFNAAVKGGIGSLFSASASIQKAVTTSHASGKVEVSAYQLGGDPSALPDIFKKDPSGVYHIVGCTLDNLDNCKKAIGDILDYATGEFKRQISPSGGKPQGNLSVVGAPVSLSYATQFNIDSPPSPDPAITYARLNLAKNYHAIQSNKEFVTHFLNSLVSPYIVVSAKDALKSAQFNLTWDNSLFDQFNAMACYKPGLESQCPTIVNYIANSSLPVDQQLIDKFKKGSYWVNWVQKNYYVIPLGENQYIRFSTANFDICAIYQTVLCAANWLHIEGRDTAGYRYCGNLTRSSVDCYKGIITYIDIGQKEPQTYCLIDTPI